MQRQVTDELELRGRTRFGVAVAGRLGDEMVGLQIPATDTSADGEIQMYLDGMTASV
jgi:hypothetical protein